MMEHRWPKVLVLGAGGQLGRELAREFGGAFGKGGKIIALDRKGLDITDAFRVRSTLREFRPVVIVNAAAYTQVDRAEEEPDRARVVNAEAPGVLAEEAARLGALLVHFSTDYVFDGTKKSPYTEDDEPNPVNVYGETKMEGERAIRLVHDRHLIFRTSWLYGLTGRNFVRTILRAAREKDEVHVVDDQIGCPTWSRWLAITVAEAAVIALRGGTTRWGTYHLAGRGSTSWYGLARATLEYAAKASDVANGVKECKLVPIRTSEYPTSALRPAYSALANDRVGTTFGFTIAAWEEQLFQCLDGT